MKHHKLRRKVEPKVRKILNTIKNHFGQFYKLNNDIVNFILAVVMYNSSL